VIAEDLLIMKDDIHTEYMWAVVVSEEENGRWVSLYIQRDSASKNLLRVADLTRTKIGPDMEWVKVVNEFEAAYHP
jgi:prolyl oligopeptidase